MRRAAREAALSARGFGVTAGLGAEVAEPLAARCAELGYGSIWTTDHPGADGLGTLAKLAAGAGGLDLGVGVLALDRHDPGQAAERVGRLDLDPQRLLIGIGAGLSPRPLELMRSALGGWRSALPGARLILAALGPRMCELGGSAFDGVLLDWPTPDSAERSAAWVERGAERAGRPAPALFAYVRAAVGADAETRLAKDEGFYRGLHDGYRAHFERLDAEPGTVGVQSERAAEIGPALARLRTPDVLVVRALARPEAGPLLRLAEAAAP